MYGPIANIPGYNPNATYLPPGVAAPSSYPERTAPRQQFYDMAPLPSVTSFMSSGLASSDYPAGGGIAGGIGGPDGLEYAWANNLRQLQPQAPQPNNTRQLQPFDIEPNQLTQSDIAALSQLPWDFGNFGDYNRRQTSVSAQEDGQAWINGQPDYGQLPGWSSDYYQSSFPLQPFDIQPSPLTQGQLDRLGQLPSLPDDPTSGSWKNVAANAIGMALPFPLGFLANMGYGAGTALAGDRLPSDPNASTLRTLFDPSEPGLGAKAGQWVVDLFSGPKSAAEQSAEKAYGSGGVYDTTGKGWVENTPTPSATPPVDNTWSGNNPAAWGYNADPWAGSFGAGRYDNGFTPSEWQINQGIIDNWVPQTYQIPMSPIMPIDPGASWFAPPDLGNASEPDIEMFGPGARFGTGRYNTN